MKIWLPRNLQHLGSSKNQQRRWMLNEGYTVVLEKFPVLSYCLISLRLLFIFGSHVLSGKPWLSPPLPQRHSSWSSAFLCCVVSLENLFLKRRVVSEEVPAGTEIPGCDGRGIVYLTQHWHHQNDSGLKIKIGSDNSAKSQEPFWCCIVRNRITRLFTTFRQWELWREESRSGIII